MKTSTAPQITGNITQNKTYLPYLDGAVERSGAEKQGLVGILGTRARRGPSKAQCSERPKTIVNN